MSVKLNCVLVEDDYSQSKWITAKIAEAFPESETTLLETELEFEESVSGLVLRPPNIFILDVVLKWTTPSVEMKPRPEQVRTEGRRRAGFRCFERIQGFELLKNIPVIFYSILGVNDLYGDLPALKGTFVHLEKDSNAGELIGAIQRLTRIPAVKKIRD